MCRRHAPSTTAPSSRARWRERAREVLVSRDAASLVSSSSSSSELSRIRRSMVGRDRR